MNKNDVRSLSHGVMGVAYFGQQQSVNHQRTLRYDAQHAGFCIRWCAAQKEEGTGHTPVGTQWRITWHLIKCHLPLHIVTLQLKTYQSQIYVMVILLMFC